MRKFKFRLEKIRKYKEQLEQNKKLQLASRKAVHQAEQAKLHHVVSIKNYYYRAYGARRTGKLDILTMVIARRYLDKLNRDIMMQKEIVAAAEKKVIMAQKELLEATRDKKKYEKLKERHLKAYSEELLRSETRELDEFGAREKHVTLKN